ncbi:MAG: DUF2073 domain-containing protein [Candidatus Thermoplasmatota archaeon]
MIKKTEGIKFTLVSRKKLEDLKSEDKISFILNEVKKGKILVLEEGLTPSEQASLIERTMKAIDQDTFIGIEMNGYPQDKTTIIERILGIIRKPRINIIGPAELLKTIKKDNETIETVIIPTRRET